MARVFIVGCSRSGTSVIQKALVDKLNLWSLPETSFLIYSHETFEQKIKNMRRLLSNCGISGNNNCNFDVWFRSAEVVGSKVAFNYLSSDITPLDYLTCFLDTLSIKNGYSSWVEKSPTHYQSSSNILNQNADNWVIFVVRNGLDVVASIRDRAIQSPKHFSNQYRVQYGIGLWNDSIKIANENINNNRFLVINYEKFCEFPDVITDKVKIKIGLDYKVHNDVKIETIGLGESWKANVSSEISKSPTKKHLFSAQEVLHLERNLDQVGFLNLIKSRNLL